MSKLEFYNDTGKEISLHPASELRKKDSIQPQELRKFVTSTGAYPWLKLWEQDGDLMLLVSTQAEDNEEGNSYQRDKQYEEMWNELYELVQSQVKRSEKVKTSVEFRALMNGMIEKMDEMETIFVKEEE